MKICYASVYYQPSGKEGGNAHVYQFIKQASLQGHEIWTWPEVNHPDSLKLPPGKLQKLRVLRQCNALLYRIEDYVPQFAYLMNSPIRRVLNQPLFVWEFNTVPEFGLQLGKSQEEVAQAIGTFRRYAPACDLAVCVSDKITNYVSEKLGVNNVMTVPNGSDPDLFKPGIKPFPRIASFEEKLNMVWIGSAYLGYVDFQLLEKVASWVWNSDIRDKVAFHVIGEGMPSMGEMPLNMHFHGASEYRDLPRWLAGMDIGLVAYQKGVSDFHSPLKMFDYMASGLAVISTGQTQSNQILNELGQADSALAHGDLTGVINQLTKFIQNPEILDKYKKESRGIVVNKYNWSNNAAAILQGISQLQ